MVYIRRTAPPRTASLRLLAGSILVVVGLTSALPVTTAIVRPWTQIVSLLPDILQARLACFNLDGFNSPRLAAISSYRRKPVSRKSSRIPCQARNDGQGHKAIPHNLLRVVHSKVKEHERGFSSTSVLKRAYHAGIVQPSAGMHEHLIDGSTGETSKMLLP